MYMQALAFSDVGQEVARADDLREARVLGQVAGRAVRVLVGEPSAPGSAWCSRSRTGAGPDHGQGLGAVGR